MSQESTPQTGSSRGNEERRSAPFSKGTAKGVTHAAHAGGSWDQGQEVVAPGITRAHGEKDRDSVGNQQEETSAILRRLLLKLVGYGAVVALLLTFVVGIHQVHDNDMYPALRDGDLVVTYKLGGYYTGDAVVYEADGKNHYGRVVAVAGDEVQIMEDGYFAINGNIPYERIFYPTKPVEEGVTYPYRVPEGEVFILGDMRQQATDSRTFGSVPIEQMKGKVVLVLFRGREI